MKSRFMTLVIERMFPRFAYFNDVALLLLRIKVGLVLVTSGWNDLKNPQARRKEITNESATRFLTKVRVRTQLP